MDARPSIDSYSAANSIPPCGAEEPSLINTNFTPGRIRSWIAESSGRNSALTRITSSAA